MCNSLILDLVILDTPFGAHPPVFSRNFSFTGSRNNDDRFFKYDAFGVINYFCGIPTPAYIQIFKLHFGADICSMYKLRKHDM